MANLNPYQAEVLAGFRVLVADCGTTITFTENATGTFPALLVFPTAGDENEGAGIQSTAMKGVEIERAHFVAAGVNQLSRFTVAGQSQVLGVTAIEDDPGQPIVYLASEEAR